MLYNKKFSRVFDLKNLKAKFSFQKKVDSLSIFDSNSEIKKNLKAPPKWKT